MERAERATPDGGSIRMRARLTQLRPDRWLSETIHKPGFEDDASL
jgi:hypothetical protein